MHFFPNRRNDTESTGGTTANNSFEGQHDRATVEKHDGIVGSDHDYPVLTFRTFLMGLLIAMAGTVFGFDTGQVSGFLEMPVFLEYFGEKTVVSEDHPTGYYFTNVRAGVIVALLSIGTLVGCLISGPVANKIGRKFSVPLWCIVFSVGVVIQMAVQRGQWVGIAMGRWVAGLGVGGLSVIAPLYMTETSPVRVRGAIVSCYQLFITLGIFIANCINFGTEAMPNTGSYRITMGIGFLWVLILGIGILFLPESPRHDWNHGKSDRARTTMAKFYGVPENHVVIHNETQEIQRVMEASSGDHPWYEAITGPRMFYRVALAVGLQCLQQLTGANYFFYYGTTVFQGVGIKNSYVTAMILGGVNFGSTIVGVIMARYFPRRKSLYISALWQCMCFLVFASVGQFKFKNAPTDSPEAKSAGMVMIVFACLFIFGFATTWGPLVWACIGEMFPYRYRAVAMAIATSSNWLWNFLLAFFTPFITGDIDYAYGYVFAGCNLAAAVVVFFFLIESSGKTLEEVDTMYLLHVRPIGSGKFAFDEDTRRSIGSGAGIGTDRMHLVRGKGGKLSKAQEGSREETAHAEGVMDNRNVFEEDARGHPVESSGARRDVV